MVLRVRTLATVNTPAGEVPAGEIITIPDAVYDRLRDKVEIVTDPPGGGITTTDSPESVTAQIIGNVCRIVYAPDQYQKHRHRDGETLDIDGRRLTLRIEEAAL